MSDASNSANTTPAFSDNLPRHARSADDVLESLDVSRQRGLSSKEVRRRRKKYGRNQLRETQRRSAWRILLDQFKSVVLIVLAVAAVLAFAFTQFAEGVAVTAVLLLNALIGFFSEWRAVRSMEALRKIGTSRVRLLRDGRQRQVAIDALVPGDIVLEEGGDIVPADLRLIEANNVRVEEAALTGESVAVDKRLEPVEPDTPVADRSNMLFKGTTIAEGSAVGVVVATGMQTELGRIAEMAETAEKETTPLQRRLNRLGQRLALITLGIVLVVAAAGLAAGRPTLLMIETAIALGLAAIPEGLPIVATIALARGMWLMAQRQALINRLPAVETLGATGYIFTDKTGTLTENRMTLRRVATPRDNQELAIDRNGVEPDESELDPLVRRVLEVGVLCSNASLDDEDADGWPEQSQGDPTEVALLHAGFAYGLRREALVEQKDEAREVAFDPDVMMMATFHRLDDGYDVAVKGAPQAVLEVCTTIAGDDSGEDRPFDEDQRDQWLEKAENMAGDGLRVLAVADKRAAATDEEPYADLRLLGLVGLYDPPRKDAIDAIAACQQAGIRVIMVTGDQPATARAIGAQTGLVEQDGVEVIHGRDLQHPEQFTDERRRQVLRTRIFARVSPEQKLHLVDVFQQAGRIVAMTGDGINDAPALRKADIGVAMGLRGTDAAKEAADMVLKDDALSSIVAAVAQGRVIFGNIRKSVMFMLCTNVAEILAVSLATVANAPLPLRPLQILYLNVITDVFPALALGVGKGYSGVMNRPPRDPKEPVLTHGHWAAIGGWSTLIAACVLGALALAVVWLQLATTAAVTVSFLTLGFGKLWFTFNLRDPGTTIFNNDVVRNPWVWGAIVLCIGLLLLAVYLPGLSDVLPAVPLGWRGWSVVIGMSLVPLVVGQTLRAFQAVRQ